MGINLLDPTHVLGATVWGCGFLAACLVLTGFIRRFARRIEAHLSDVTGLRFASAFAQMLVYLVAFVLYAHLIPELHTLGTALLTGVSVVSVVLGLAAQNTLGNLIAVHKKESKSGKKIMLVAHLDEIGFVVTHVDAAGFARVQPYGGINPLACVGQRVRFANGRLGVLGLDARRDDMGKIPALSEMFVDVGATSRADNPLQVGDVAGYWRPLEDLGKRLVGKSLDDRVGVAILIETLRALKRTPHEVAFVFSVQEEIGTRGAGVAAFGLEASFLATSSFSSLASRSFSFARYF